MTPHLSTLLGACVGSFLNVCMSRWKNGKQVLYPPSFCPKCHKTIRWYDNIPILSFILLGAKCRSCHKPISWQYPMIELISCVLFLTCALCFRNDPVKLFASFTFVSFMILFFMSDFKWKVLPHPFTNLFILIGLALSWRNFFSTNFNSFSVVCGFMGIGSLMYAFFWFYPRGLGGGDVKMLAGLAVWMGFSNSFFVLLFASVVGFLVVIVLILMKKISRKSTVPFGTFLAVGATAIDRKS